MSEYRFDYSKSRPNRFARRIAKNTVVERGPVIKPSGKSRITIYLDDDILEAFRRRADASGRGYQTMINETLRAALGHEAQAVDARTLRRILREELRRTG